MGGGWGRATLNPAEGVTSRILPSGLSPSWKGRSGGGPPSVGGPGPEVRRVHRGGFPGGPGAAGDRPRGKPQPGRAVAADLGRMWSKGPPVPCPRTALFQSLAPRHQRWPRIVLTCSRELCRLPRDCHHPPQVVGQKTLLALRLGHMSYEFNLPLARPLSVSVRWRKGSFPGTSRDHLS